MSVFYNIRAQFVEDVPYLIDLTSKHKPRWALVMDGLQLAIALKNASPTTNVIHRVWPDHELNLSPAQWLTNKKNEIGNADVWAYTVNEIGLQPDWHIELIKESDRRGWPVKLVIGNPSVGTPQDIKEWETPKVLELLRLLDKHRENVVLGLHEYGHGVIVSGLQDKHFELNPALWPASIDANKNNWHCGRFKFALQACERYNIKPPRIVITEHGFDYLGDMASMLPGGGWHTLWDEWKLWFGKSPEEAYAFQLVYADNVIYRYGGDIVEGQLIFQYGAKESGLWNAFDVERFRTLHKLLFDNERKPTAPQEPIPSPDEPELPELPEPISEFKIRMAMMVEKLSELNKEAQDLNRVIQNMDV